MPQDSSSGYAGLRSGAAVFERSETGRLLLSGGDRRSYLQGLLTNDIEALTPGTGCYAAMLNAQGRMLTDMRVLELGDAILLDVPSAVTAAIREHLDRFIFSEDVRVEDVTDARAELGLYGPGSDAVLGALSPPPAAPARLFGSARVRIDGVDLLLVRSDAIGIAGYDLILDRTASTHLHAILRSAGAVPATPADVEVVRVEAGMPRFGTDMDTDTIPLEAGLEDRAISRSKGCYVGQEVIVRVIDRGRGRVARRLVGLTLNDGSTVPAGGGAIASNGREIGRVTSAVWSPSRGRPVALGYVHRDFAEPGTTVTIEGAGTATVAPLHD